MICRQCAVTRQDSGLENRDMTRDEAVEHLIAVHPSRAATLVKSLITESLRTFQEEEEMLSEAFRDRCKEGDYK